MDGGFLCKKTLECRTEGKLEEFFFTLGNLQSPRATHPPKKHGHGHRSRVQDQHRGQQFLKK